MAIVVYDSDCGFCKACLAVLLSADRTPGALTPIPLGTEEADRLLASVPSSERTASWHLVDDAGALHSAGAALAPALRLVRGGAVPAAAFARFPRTTERGYRWVVRHRALLGRFVPARAKRWADRVIEAHGGPARPQ